VLKQGTIGRVLWKWKSGAQEDGETRLMDYSKETASAILLLGGSSRGMRMCSWKRKVEEQVKNGRRFVLQDSGGTNAATHVTQTPTNLDALIARQ
jgi:hypothetical protein